MTRAYDIVYYLKVLFFRVVRELQAVIVTRAVVLRRPLAAVVTRAVVSHLCRCPIHPCRIHLPHLVEVHHP